MKIKIDIRRKIFKPIINELGGNIRFIISGASAIDKKVAKGFNDFGILTVQGYGLTETSPVLSAENEKNIKYGSIGKPMPSVELKIENKNIASNIYDLTCTDNIYSTDVNLAFLPLHHAFGSTGMILFLANGATNVFCDGLRHIQNNLKEYKVTTFVCVPLLLENKRIAIIGKNSYEWVCSYISVICGVGVAVPLDKGLQDDEIISLLNRSKADAIIFENKYLELIKKIKKEKNTQTKEFICMNKNE